MSICGSRLSEESYCSPSGMDRKGSIFEEVGSLPSIQEPITCPYQKAIMLSMRLQGIMMQQMKEEVMKNRRVFKVFLRPTKQFMETREARDTCSGSVNMVEELVNQLGEDLGKIRTEFDKLQEKEEMEASRLRNNLKCTCGVA